MIFKINVRNTNIAFVAIVLKYIKMTLNNSMVGQRLDSVPSKSFIGSSYITRKI